jgi:hypothetical protein
MRARVFMPVLAMMLYEWSILNSHSGTWAPLLALYQFFEADGVWDLVCI